MKEIESEKYIKQKLRDYTDYPLVDDKQRKKLIHVQIGKLQESFEDGYECANKWIDVNDSLPDKCADVLCIVEQYDGTTSAEIRWRSIHEDVITDENGFAIYPPVETRVLAWMEIPEYKHNE